MLQKFRPHLGSGGYREGGGSLVLNRRRRVDESKVRLQFRQLKGEMMREARVLAQTRQALPGRHKTRSRATSFEPAVWSNLSWCRSPNPFVRLLRWASERLLQSNPFAGHADTRFDQPQARKPP